MDGPYYGKQECLMELGKQQIFTTRLRSDTLFSSLDYNLDILVSLSCEFISSTVLAKQKKVFLNIRLHQL